MKTLIEVLRLSRRLQHVTPEDPVFSDLKGPGRELAAFLRTLAVSLQAPYGETPEEIHELGLTFFKFRQSQNQITDYQALRTKCCDIIVKLPLDWPNTAAEMCVISHLIETILGRTPDEILSVPVTVLFRKISLDPLEVLLFHTFRTIHTLEWGKMDIVVQEDERPAQEHLQLLIDRWDLYRITLPETDLNACTPERLKVIKNYDRDANTEESYITTAFDQLMLLTATRTDEDGHEEHAVKTLIRALERARTSAPPTSDFELLPDVW